jgi:2-C-methyl-D-erythritol 4-phosphate cytidylyltransferase
VVAPESLTGRLQEEAIERFGLDEVDAVIADPGGLITALQQAVEALPEGVEKVVVHEAQRLLVPGSLVDRLCDAAGDRDAVIPAVPLSGTVFVEDGEEARPAPARDDLRRAQGPLVLKAQVLKDAINSRAAEEEAGRNDGVDATQVGSATHAGPLIAERMMRLGVNLNLVDGDIDNFLILSQDDLSRALEVFSRRAVDYAFVYPKEFLPDDPLAAALGTGRGGEAGDDGDENASKSDGKSEEGAAADDGA